MRTQYYTYHPRNFGNEYTLIKVDTEDEKKRLMAFFIEINPFVESYHRQSYKEVQHLKAAERAYRKYNHLFSGYCNPWEPKSVDEFLSDRN